MPMIWSDEQVDAEVARHDPVPTVFADAAQTPDASALLSRILDIDYMGGVAHEAASERARQPKLPRFGFPRWVALRPQLAMGVAAVLLAAALGGALPAVVGGRISPPIKSTWRQARPLAEPSAAHQRVGTWRLVDELLGGIWQQNVYGPPPGQFSCSPEGTCYVLAGKYPTASEGAPLLSASLYKSTDDGAAWSVIPLPAGFAASTPLECSGPQWCAAGATYNGQPVLAFTRDGGHSFTMAPLPAGVGTFHQLSCLSTDVCEGLAGHQGTTPLDATFLVTDDGGSTFHDSTILADDSMVGLACSTSTRCTVVGQSDASMKDATPTSVSAVTSNQGRTWTQGSVPPGFGIDGSSSLACPDAQHCFVTGIVPMRVRNPPICATQGVASSQGASEALPSMGPQAEAISKRATEILAAQTAKETTVNYVECTNGITDSYAIASSEDGGLTWTLETPPSNVPRPWLTGLACPTDTQCWAAGQESVPRRVGTGIDMASPVLIGTADGGSTWSRVVFSVPATAPNYTGQSYNSMSSITCPSTSLCLARGAAAQGSSYAAVYDLVEPTH